MKEEVRLTDDVFVNIVIREGMVEARVPALASQRALLGGQTHSILVLKRLPVGGRQGRKDSEKEGPGFCPKIASTLLFMLLCYIQPKSHRLGPASIMPTSSTVAGS